jgi:hypothetical protein
MVEQGLAVTRAYTTATTRRDAIRGTKLNVAAEGWGTFYQQVGLSGSDASLEVRWGRVCLQAVTLQLPEDRTGNGISATWNKNRISARADVAGGRVTIALESPVELKSGDVLQITVA